MRGILKFFGLYNLIGKPAPLFIHDFREVRYVSSKIPEPNDIFVNNNNQDVKFGYIRYYITTGQIGLFFIDKEYQNRGLGKQILSKLIEELETNKCEEVWAVSTDNHTFWSNVYNKSFTHRVPAHPSVTGSGYFMKIREENNIELCDNYVPIPL